MRIEYFTCDFCKRKNPDGEEFRNEVILSSHETEVKQRSWKLCAECLLLATDWCLDNQEKNG